MSGTKWRQRIASGLLCMALAGGLMPFTAAGATNAAQPTQEGYVSLHQYISPTDEPDVYKVTLSIKGDPGQIPETEIAMLIDGSSSMNEVGSSNTFLDTYPDPVMFPGWTNPITRQQFLTHYGLDLGTSLPNGFAGMPTDPASLASWVTPMTAGQDTRIRAALTGVNEAVDIFLNPNINAGAKVTSAGVVVFNSGADADIEPYKTLDTVVTTVGYGFTEYDNDARDSIVYSTRMFREKQIDTFGGDGKLGYNMTDQTPPGSAFATSILNRPLPKVIDSILADSANKTYTKEMQQEVSRGMIPYDEKGLHKTLLQSALNDVKASTVNSESNIEHGIMEAAVLLGVDPIGSGAPSVKGTPASATDGKRRFVIILTDGEDTGLIENTLGIVSRMKNAGVQFYVMGIQTAGAEVQKTNHEGLGYNKDGSIWPGAIYVDDTSHGVPSPWQTWDGMKGIKSASDLLKATPALSSEFEQPLVFMATDYLTDKNSFKTTYADWEAVEADYLGGPSQGSPDWNRADPKYYYVGETKNITQEIKDTFAEIAKKIIQFGENAKTEISLSSNFSIYQYPGKPLFATTGPENQTVSNKGGVIDWNFNGDGVPTMKEATLTFYIKLDLKAAKTGEYYSPLEKVVFTATGPFPGEGTKPRYGWPERDVAIKFPQAYVTVGGEVKVENGSGTEIAEGQQNAVKPDLSFEDAPTVSAALPMVGGAGSLASRQDAEITGVDSKKLKTGKTQVSVSVKNGSDMYYQWQSQDSEKKWVDIFGANSSTYTLGKKFKTNAKYQLRCVVSNASGKKFNSDSLEVTATKAEVANEKLQSTN